MKIKQCKMKGNYIMKQIQFYTLEEPEAIKEITLKVDPIAVGKSNLILNYLQRKFNLLLVHEIKTLKNIKIVKFTKSDLPNEICIEKLNGNNYRNSKEIFDYLNNEYDLEFIHSIANEDV